MAQKKGGEEASTAPAFERTLGNIHVAVWRNPKENGDAWYNTKIVRRYHDGSDWQDSTSYCHSDLPIVIVAACMAYFWIWEQRVLGSRRQEASE